MRDAIRSTDYMNNTFSPETKAWTDLYRKVREESIHHKNVILFPDMAYKPTEPEMLVNKVEKRGFALDENTVVTLGGEYLDVCVNKVARQILTLPEINRVRIDKNASVNTDYSGQKTPMTEKFKKNYDDNFSLTEDENYIYIEKVAELAPAL